jgi:hypothetical protein
MQQPLPQWFAIQMLPPQPLQLRSRLLPHINQAALQLVEPQLLFQQAVHQGPQAHVHQAVQAALHHLQLPV